MQPSTFAVTLLTMTSTLVTGHDRPGPFSTCAHHKRIRFAMLRCVPSMASRRSATCHPKLAESRFEASENAQQASTRGERRQHTTAHCTPAAGGAEFTTACNCGECGVAQGAMMRLVAKTGMDREDDWTEPRSAHSLPAAATQPVATPRVRLYFSVHC